METSPIGGFESDYGWSSHFQNFSSLEVELVLVLIFIILNYWAQISAND